MMPQYLINYREKAPIDADAQTVSAHRVEGWSNDYAFFGHPERFDEVTRVIPRSLVAEVTMVYDENGEAL